MAKRETVDAKLIRARFVGEVCFPLELLIEAPPMKRDMDLIRALLLATEADAESLPGDFPPEAQSYHVALLVDAGLVEALIQPGPMGEPRAYHIFRLTWAGHEFLDAMREDTVWKKAKEHVLKPGTSWTFDVLKEWLKLELKAKLGFP